MSQSSWVSHWPHIVVVNIKSGEDMNELSLAIADWVYQAYPNSKRGTWNTSGDWAMAQFARGYDVVFKETDAAALFKLAWGAR